MAEHADESETNIVDLAARRPLAPESLRVVDAYWNALADGRLMPKRSEIDPTGIADVLDRVFLIEQVAPGHARMRVAGNRLSSLLEMDLRGMPLSALFHPTTRPDLAEALSALFNEPARLRMRLDGVAPLFSSSRMRAEMLVLPLRDDEGRVTRAIGAIEFQGQLRSPQRFRIGQQDRRTLIGYADARLPGPPARPLPGAETGARKRPTLTLVT